MIDSAWIAVSDLSVVEPNVYEGRGTSKALHRVMDRDGRTGLWKEYKEDAAAAIDPSLLVELVRWPATLTDRQRERLLPHLAHPWAVVMNGYRVAGVLMPEASGAFFYRDRRGKLRPRTIDTLSNSRRSAGPTGSPFFEPPHRLALLGRLLILVSELHDAGVVVGDLQPQNILVCADPRQPAVLVLDCDSFWLNGRHAFGPPIDPETWRSPWMGTSFSNQTDLFKLALLVTRCLQEDNRDWYPRREVLTQFMPSHQVQRLEGLLAKEITVSAQQLRGLAGNWRSRVGTNGTMYNSTDAFVSAPWTPPPEAADPPWGTRPAGATAAQPWSQPSSPSSGLPASQPPAGPAQRGGAPPSYPVTPPPMPGQGPVPAEPIRAPQYPPQPGQPGQPGQLRQPGRQGRSRARVLAWLLGAAVAGSAVASAVQNSGR